VLTGLLHAPVRFFMDYLRPEDSDPRHLGFTFAQWASFLAFLVSAYVAAKILKSGKPHPTVTKTSREAQERLRVILKEDDEAREAEKKGKAKDAVTAKKIEKTMPKAVAKKAESKKAEAEQDDDADEKDADEKADPDEKKGASAEN
jgi:hypothetical protein